MHGATLYLFVFSLIFLAPFAGAKLTHPKTVAAKNRQNNPQKRRCNDGVAYACYDYGLSLRNSRNPKDRKEAEAYIRRACTLAYAPACEGRAQVTKTVKQSDLEKPAAVVKTHEPVPLLEQPSADLIPMAEPVPKPQPTSR